MLIIDVIVNLTDAIVRSTDVIVNLSDVIVRLIDAIVYLSDVIVRLTDVIPQLFECSVLWLCACAGSMGAMAKAESVEMELKLTCVGNCLKMAVDGMCSAIEIIDEMNVR